VSHHPIPLLALHICPNTLSQHPSHRRSNIHSQASIVLNMVVCMFSEYCAAPFTVEPVDVVRPDGVVMSYPDLSSQHRTVATEIINRLVHSPDLAHFSAVFHFWFLRF
jgi:hypothetical protein